MTPDVASLLLLVMSFKQSSHIKDPKTNRKPISSPSTDSNSFQTKSTASPHFSASFRCPLFQRKANSFCRHHLAPLFSTSSIVLIVLQVKMFHLYILLTAQDIQTPHLYPGKALELGRWHYSGWLHHCLIWSFQYRTHKIDLQSFKLTTPRDIKKSLKKFNLISWNYPVWRQ